MRNANSRAIGWLASVAAFAIGAVGTQGDATGPVAASLRFDAVFATRGEPRRLHYVVAYRGSDGVHRLEIWRDGDTRLKRVTDRRVTTLVTHAPHDADFIMQVIDPQKHTSTRIDRASLYRIGNFTDWFDLAHGIRHPRMSYRLVARPPLGSMPRTPVACRWYAMDEANRTTSICWDESDAVPLLIATGPGHPVWRVLSIDKAPFRRDTFQPDDRGYIHDDATRDIAND